MPRRHAVSPALVAAPTPPMHANLCASLLDRDLSASSAPLASTPPLPPRDTRSLRDEPRLAPSLLLSSPSSGDSSSEAGSPSQHPSPRSITLDPPPLPFLGSRRAEEESLASSPDNRRAESSVYYTTAWGSPYAAPSTRRLSLTLSQYAGVDHASGASSPENHHELRRTSVAIHAEEPIDQRHETSNRNFTDFTRDWVNQFLTGQPRTERSNWLSDDSGSEAPSFQTAHQNQLADDLSDDWLGLDETVRDSDLLKTPTLSDFVGRRDVARSKTKKTTHKRAGTLRQEDFWGFAYDKESPQKMSDSNEPQPAAEVTSPIEKPLPLPPAGTADEQTEQTDTTEAPSSAVDNLKKEVSEINRSATQTLQRRKKKLAWKGKACIIDFPIDDNRGSEAAGNQPLMTSKDVEAKMKKWEEEGYDIRGFTIGELDDSAGPTELGGLTRPLYPDPAELYEEGKGQRAYIRFPNRAVWDSYVQELQEEKLRALGVLAPDDEPGPSVSPSNASINPSQPPFGLVGSPPIPTASAAGNHLAAAYPFSPQFGQSTGATSGGIGSLASPASQFSVQTPFMGMEQNMVPNLPFHQFQPTPPAQGSMTPQSLINLGQANGSTGPGGFHNFNSILSPVSPLHEQGYPGLNEGFNEKDVYDDRFPHMGHEDGPPFPTPQTPVNVPDQFHANVEIAHPTPRGHGHNLSESLQRGLDQMNHSEYRPDDQAERHIGEEYNGPHGLNADMLQSRWAMPEDEPRQPQHATGQSSLSFSQHPHQFYGNQFGHENNHEGSDLDTNPSLTGTPQTRPIVNQPWHEPHVSGGSFHGHASKLSTSSLNVEAKEFDPSASFSSQVAPFAPNAFQFGGVSGFGFDPAPPNFGASGFMNGPPNPPPQPEPKRSSFKFSAASFNVDAPVFNPSASINSNASSELPSSATRTKIFGDIDVSEIAKPPKKSKAIPIVRPDEVEGGKDDEEEEKKKEDDNAQEDEQGRPIFTDRHKRARRVMGHATEPEMRYSVSNISPLGELGNAQASSTLHTVAEGKENSFPDDGKHLERRSSPVSEAFTLFDYKNEGDAAKSSIQEEPAQENIPVSEESAKHATSDSKSKDSILSPTAPAFEFKPAVPEFVPTAVQPSNFAVQEPEEKQPQAPKPAEKKGGLMASRFATDSPPKSKPPPASETIGTVPFKAPEETNAAAKELLERYRESTEESTDQEDIDAVMDQLNNSDDDLGIDRQHTPLPSRFISDSLGGPTKEKRFGSAEGRSEAPSPSPGGGPKTHKLDIPRFGSDVDGQSNVTFSPQKSLISRLQSPVRQLITENDHVSDWDDMISSGEDEKFFNRNRFFDRRINDLVGSAIDDRLVPMDRALAVIQQSVASIASGTASRRALRGESAEMEDSDADDEDDGEEQEESVRARSPPQKRDRKLEMMKSVMMEALATHSLPHRQQHSSQSEINLLKENIARLEATISKKIVKDPVAEIQQSIADALETNQHVQEVAREQMRDLDEKNKALEEKSKDLERQLYTRDQDKIELTEQVAALRATLSHSAEHADTPLDPAELLKLQTELQKSKTEIDHLREENDHLREEKEAIKEKDKTNLEILATEKNGLEATVLDLENRIAELSGKNIDLMNEQNEAGQLKRDNQQLTKDLTDLHVKNGLLETENQQFTRDVSELQSKYSHLKQDHQQLVQDKAELQTERDEHLVSNSKLREELDSSEGRNMLLRERAEFMRIQMTQSESLREKLIGDMDTLQKDVATLTSNVTKSHADYRAKEQKLGSDLIHESSVRASLEKELEEIRAEQKNLAEIKVEFPLVQRQKNDLLSENRTLRDDLQVQHGRNAELEKKLDQVNLAVEVEKERGIDIQNKLDQANLAVQVEEARRELLVTESENAQNSLKALHEHYETIISQDRARNGELAAKELDLANKETDLHKKRCEELEGRLKIAESAARAAAEAAQSAKTSPVPFPAPTAPPAHSNAPSMSYNQSSNEPDRISPQALRESILVLQDQLQQRETRIEELEQEASTIDKDAPNKLREKDSEINWLRELLGVRIDDLQDIIKTLSQPSFNKHAVRDAAIRLKANLQMQQQERERAMSGGLGALPSIADIAASPRNLPLAAAAAWGNWRKGRDNANGGSNPSDQTPSKSNNTGGFLSGLLTPPSSHVRANALPNGGPARSYVQSRPLRGLNSTPRRGSLRQDATLADPPQTPPLLRRSSYDHDAEPGNYEEDTFATDDIESTVGGMVSAVPRDMGDDSFGPQISTLAEELEE